PNAWIPKCSRTGMLRPRRSMSSRRAACSFGSSFTRSPPCPAGRRESGDTLPQMAESRPAALPPAERTVGQVVAEAIRAYGDRFWQILPLGLAVVGVDAANLHHGVDVQTLILWAFAPVFAAAYVR